MLLIFWCSGLDRDTYRVIPGEKLQIWCEMKDKIDYFQNNPDGTTNFQLSLFKNGEKLDSTTK